MPASSSDVFGLPTPRWDVVMGLCAAQAALGISCAHGEQRFHATKQTGHATCRSPGTIRYNYQVPFSPFTAAKDCINNN